MASQYMTYESHYSLNSKYDRVRHRIEPWMDAKKMIDELKDLGATELGAKMILWNLLERRLPDMQRSATNHAVGGAVYAVVFSALIEVFCYGTWPVFGYLPVFLCVVVSVSNAYLRFRLYTLSKLLSDAKLEKIHLRKMHRDL